MRKVVLVIAISAAAVAGLYVWHQASTHRLRLSARFQTAAGLKEGAPVAVDGLQLGSIDQISVRPERGDHPVEVSMTIRTEQISAIPSDSLARVTQQGILGPTMVDIDTRGAVGPPLANRGTLIAANPEQSDSKTAQAIEKVGTTLVEQVIQAQKKVAPQSSPTQQ